jgi:Zn-dependent protease with chaperone function
VIFITLAVGLAYLSSRTHHRELMRNALQVNPDETSDLARVIRECVAILQAYEVEVFVAQSPMLNAYTFGLSAPKTVVLYSALFKVMDEDELHFILGHELGHIRLGHTSLNSLVGGMAGVPNSSSASVILTLAFLGWNRACEYSADRAGLLTCGKPEKAITALIKLVAGPKAFSREGMALAYHQIDAEDDTIIGDIGEALGTHPLLIRRINKLRSYAKSGEYQRLQSQVNQNI